jgi:hypothetical protein
MLADSRDDDQRNAAEVDQTPLVRIRGGVEVRALTGSLTAEQIDDFAALAEKGAADIGRFTGVAPQKQRILIYLSPRVDISHTYPHYPGSFRHEPRVFIDSERVADRSAPYLHELVHAVAGDGGPMWLDEGFAEWVASSVATTYGGYYAPVMSAANDRVDAQARAVIERAPDVATAGNWFTTDEPQLSSQRERRAFYVLAHSFTKFLATSLGTSRLVSIHQANEAQALARVTGVSIEEWERRWMKEIGKGDGEIARR